MIEAWVLFRREEVSEWPLQLQSPVSNCKAVPQWSGTIKAAVAVVRRELFYVNQVCELKLHQA